MKLALLPLTITCAVLLGGVALLCGLLNMWFPPYAELLLQLLGSVYPGYTPDGSFGSVINVTLYALLDGALGGAVFGWLYNCLVGKFKNKK